MSRTSHKLLDSYVFEPYLISLFSFKGDVAIDNLSSTLNDQVKLSVKRSAFHVCVCLCFCVSVLLTITAHGKAP